MQIENNGRCCQPEDYKIGWKEQTKLLSIYANAPADEDGSPAGDSLKASISVIAKIKAKQLLLEHLKNIRSAEVHDHEHETPS
jgi:hypothetical protein